VREYNKYFDICNAVVGETHQKGILKRIPEFWGVLVVSLEDGQPKVFELRPADMNPKDINANKLSLLWKSEIQSIAVKTVYPNIQIGTKNTF